MKQYVVYRSKFVHVEIDKRILGQIFSKETYISEKMKTNKTEHAFSLTALPEFQQATQYTHTRAGQPHACPNGQQTGLVHTDSIVFQVKLRRQRDQVQYNNRS